MRKSTFLAAASLSLSFTTGFTQDRTSPPAPILVQPDGAAPRSVLLTPDTLPDALRSLQLPASFTWISGMERTLPNGSMAINARFRTNLQPDEVHDAGRAAMLRAGWQPVETPRFPGAVFISTHAPDALRACRDGQSLVLSTVARGDTTEAVFNLQRLNPGGCSTPVARPTLASSLIDQMPVLELPPAPAGSQPVRGGGGSYREGMTETRTLFAFSGTAATAADFLAGQLEAQGWKRDAAWVGKETAGSTWMRHPEGQRPIHATLHVTDMGDRQFSAMFRALEKP